MSFETLLVANRGEIACRIIESAKSLGYRTVAVFSEADRQARHVSLADVAVFIGGAQASESYLKQEAILKAAKQSGAGAIHPGYGFLSENASFAQACAEAGLIFVGPSPEAIHAMGDKAQAKARMRASGVPCVPGFDAEDPSDEQLIAAAAGIGYPLLIKASAGGGGRGMRRVDDGAQLVGAIQSARAEAQGAFGSACLLLEKLVEGARHVEVQIFADIQGHSLHFGERDCSVQRRHQKVVEEAPCPVVDAQLRSQMGAAAVAAAKAVGYVGAGTVEFLLAPDKSFYFLEMNTRLQVEHPVTEMVTGLDLVALQLSVAQGETLPLIQEDVKLEGHAIEVRIYAEDPSENYQPQTGMIHHFEAPVGLGIRVDHGLCEQDEVGPHYDPMIAKVIAHGASREIARRRVLRALERTYLFGIKTNISLLQRILVHPRFQAGDLDTAFLETTPALLQESEAPDASLHIAAALYADSQGYGTSLRNSDPLEQPLDLEVESERIQTRILVIPGGYDIKIGNGQKRIHLGKGEGLSRRIDVDGLQCSVVSVLRAGMLWLLDNGRTLCAKPWDPSPMIEQAQGQGRIVAPLAARVLSVSVEVGQRVLVGDPIVVIEAMKLETVLRAEVDGIVQEVRAVGGRAVAAGDLLVSIEAEEQK